MTDKEKLIKILTEIGVDFYSYETNETYVVGVKNEICDDEEERSFSFKFHKVNEQYFE